MDNKNFLKGLNSKLPGDVEVLKPGSLTVLKYIIIKQEEVYLICEPYCSSTWGNKKYYMMILALVLMMH